VIVRFREPFLAVLAVAAGSAIAVVDSRPGWDDTGVSVVLLAFASFGIAAAAGRRPWLWALLVGAWTPLLEIPAQGGSGPLAALVVATLGAYAGYGASRLLVRPAVD
jgi:hypothetical protein